MKNNICIPSLVLFVAGISDFNAEDAYSAPQPIVRALPAPPVKFKSTNLEGQVEESLQHAKKGVLG